MGEIAEIVAVDEHGAALRIIEAQDEGEHGALAGAAGADEGDALSGRDAQVDAFERGNVGAVGEGDAVELDFAAAGGEHFGVSGVGDGAGLAHQGEDVGGGGKAALQLEVDAAEGFDRLVEEKDAGHEGEELGGGESGGEHIEEGEADAERGHHLDQRGSDFGVFVDAHGVAELVHHGAVEGVGHEFFPRE